VIHISAQLSVYPLRQENLAPTIQETVQIVRRHELEVHPGAMSTLVIGDDDKVFAALKDALRTAAAGGDVVMVVTLSNACPAFQPSGATWGDE
jgi:uncharacterized protein YqgV (UPF0045/DUF77 family)